MEMKFGIYRDDQSRVIRKIAYDEVLTPPEISGLTFYEVATHEALASIEVYKTEDQQNEKKIDQEIRDLAIDSLKGKGKLPPNFKDK